MVKGKETIGYTKKILTIDIETAPAEMWGWGMFKQNFGVEQVKAHPYILMIGYKWLGQPAHIITNWEYTQEEMLLAISDLCKEADAIITKNGARFDVPWIRTELLKYRLPPLVNVTNIDLEKAARAYFRFHSNKLEYILKYLGLGQKVPHEGFALWRKVMEGDPKARKRMVHYCKGDLIGTERLYKEMRPHILNHPALRAIGSTACAKCGSKNTKKDGFRYTACFQVQQHQCNNCHGYFSGKRVKVA